MIVVLTGGTGGAKLIEGLAVELDPAQLTIICNTGDDAIFQGLYVSPDIDTITYTLAGLSDTAKGWGIKDDTFVVLDQLRRLGNEAWFNLGDKDLATHITRTRLMKEGWALSAVTDHLRRTLGVRAVILPMSDQRVETLIETPEGEISFQEFFVKERWSRKVTGVCFAGAEQSRPAPGVLEAIQQAQAIVICPSNPITSLEPILAVPGIRSALQKTRTPVVGVSPIVGTAAISGPAHQLMKAVGWESSALGIARSFKDFLDTLLIANEDRKLTDGIEKPRCICTDIHMVSRDEKRRLAREVLALCKK
jgi:LPPG:FO 2-phospho-L-lactate transferase